MDSLHLEYGGSSFDSADKVLTIYLKLVLLDPLTEFLFFFGLSILSSNDGKFKSNPFSPNVYGLPA